MKRKTIPEAARPAFTSLIDIAFLVLIFFMCLPFRRLDAKLEAHLPKSEGIEIRKADPTHPIRIRLRMRRDAVRYELGDHAAETPGGLERVLRRLDPHDKYEVHASSTVPWKAVVATVNLLKKLEIEQVRFTGTSIPGHEIRKAIPLPMPD